MGHPNWKRLAELGQLPKEMESEVSGDILDTQINSLKSSKERVKEVKEAEAKDNMTIEEILNEQELGEEDKLNLKTKSELEDILLEAKADAGGNRKQLIARILALPKEEVKKEEEEVVEDAPRGEFIDELLK